MIYINKYKILSLGYNCFIKKYINDIGISQETNLFDYIGTSMWTINKLFENDFIDLFNIDEYENIQILKDGEKVITNKRYYIRFMHDFKNLQNGNDRKLLLNNDNKKFIMNTLINYNIMDEMKKRFNSFKETYIRRINRLKNILNTEKNILFIRFEEPQENRIIYNEYKENFKKLELEYIKDFSNIIKLQYPNLNFKIIYISNTHKLNYLKDFNIIILNTDKKIDSWGNSSSILINIFEINKKFLEDIENL